MVIISRIGIIGAGISGVAAAKQLSEYDPIVFEATECLGGVWKHCSYKSTKLQTPRCDYEFSDYPWPQRDYNTSFPSYEEILDYLHSYATHFDVLKFIKFNSKVVEIKFVGNYQPEELEENEGVMAASDHEYGNLLSGQPVWEVAVHNTQSDSIEVFLFSR